MQKIKKTVYTLDIDNYEPEITQITFPFMERWADKIGADFYIIKDRKFPDYPIPCEKFQIHELGKEHGNDWNIFFDADTLISPDFFDVTAILNKDMTLSNGTDFVFHRFRPNEYFLRDSRYIGKGNWCAIASDWCLDYWMPPRRTAEEIAKDIFPTVAETSFGITAEHLIDDYTTSENISRFGLKHDIIPNIDIQGLQGGLIAHQYLMDTKSKVEYLNRILNEQWKIKL